MLLNAGHPFTFFRKHGLFSFRLKNITWHPKMTSRTHTTKPVKIIQPGSSSTAEYVREMWYFRHLIGLFVAQEFKAQYVQTRLNVFWIFLRPLMVLGLFTLIFAGIIPIQGLLCPYPLFAFTGLIVWNNFSFMVNNCGNVIVANQQLVKKMYFPRVLLIAAKAIIGLIELMASMVMLFVLLLVFKYPLSFQLVFAPFIILGGLIIGLSVAVWLNALTIRHRDLNHFIPTLIGFLIWMTPVFYPVTLIPEKYSFMLYLNPIAGVIQGLRWSILGDVLPSVWYLPSFFLAVLFLVAGFKFFIHAEVDLADHI